MNIIKIYNKDDIYKGCILASIAHAIMIAHYPELSYEHSWDGNNYSVQDSAGIRGTITFTEQYCVAAFRNENSKRLMKIQTANNYFKNAPKQVIEIALKDTLQYLLEEINSEIIPVITTSFWGTKDELYSNDTFDDMNFNGLNILENQLLCVEVAIKNWKEYYDMSTEQTKLLNSLYNKKFQIQINQL